MMGMAWRVGVLAILFVCLHPAISGGIPYTNGRPPPYERKFVSPVIDKLIVNITSRMKDPLLATLFTNCFPNTLDTTIMNFTFVDGIPDTVIVTGDIPAMWLRDSTNQVFPYLPYATLDGNLQNMLLGVVFRQAKSILIDAYANAFIDTYLDNITSPWAGDIRYPAMNPSLVWEGKYELDSLTAFLRLSYYYYYYTQDTTHFKNSMWVQAVYKAVQTMRTQQKSTVQDRPPAYSFQRFAENPTDTLEHGTGAPANYTGMVKSAFRPSDDSHTLPFPISANSMTVVALLDLVPIFGPINASFADELKSLAAQIQQGIMDFGIVNHPVLGPMFAFEVDGFGNTYSMDDSNIPSLLSLPYLRAVKPDSPLYANTRKFVLSSRNPYYYSGSVASGIGGPHIGFGYVWPLAIMMQAQTSNDDNEIRQCLEWLKVSSAGTGFMHESFNCNDANDFTRSWFAWANSQFGHLILTLAEERPYLIFNNSEQLTPKISRSELPFAF